MKRFSKLSASVCLAIGVTLFLMAFTVAVTVAQTPSPTNADGVWGTSVYSG